MKERPILFSGPMVRAILDGRKTQTRRAIKLKTGETFDEHALTGAIQEWRPVYDDLAGKVVAKRPALIKCPFGKPGDRLWVREAFMHEPAEYDWSVSTSIPHLESNTIYRADSDPHNEAKGIGWKPSIHMPRNLSRITLEITDVRVERLHHINEKDCRAEGYPLDRDERSNGSQIDPWLWFRGLWVEINGPGSWFENPWVWVVEFRRVEMCET